MQDRLVDRKLIFWLFVGATLTASLSGCIWDEEHRGKLDLGVAPEKHPMADSPAYRDSIGSMGYFDGMGAMRVRGYGLVVGLGKNGSSDAPRAVHERLVQSLYKHYHTTSSVVGSKPIAPETLIDDVDTAVVVVIGDIPPAASKGTRFDISVTALSGTQTKSLRGGRLYTVDLEVYRTLPSGVSITGKILARASGPIFLNPFSSDDSATKSNDRQAMVVSGGLATRDRRLRFVVTPPSYRRAQQIEQRINAQFAGSHRVASAVSPSFVNLNVPREYEDDTGHFLELVKSLYISREPAFEVTRARALAKELVRTDAPHARIALGLEGLGREALAVLDELYASTLDYVSFHAAVAGLRLGDHVAADRMALFSRDEASPFRYQAIRALGETTEMASTAITLRELLHDDDPRVQVAAYEQLRKRNDRSIISRPIGRDNYILDLIPASKTSFVYVKRRNQRRIALFGSDLKFQLPLLYRAMDGCVTISAEGSDDHLTILRTVVSTGTTSPPIQAPNDVAQLAVLLGDEPGVDGSGQATGLGLDYGVVVHVLQQFCKDKSILAKFILEEPNVAELFGPMRATGRPESEL